MVLWAVTLVLCRHPLVEEGRRLKRRFARSRA
jgi:hypothetical protein